MKALLLATLLLPAAAYAVDGPGMCAPDAAALCPKIPFGPKRLRCLHAHEDKLSPACKEHLADMHAKGQEFRDACKADIGESCLNLQRRALLECLESRGEKLSKPCAEKVAAIRDEDKSHHELISAACKADAEKLCKGVVSGDGRIGACLRQHQAQLSKPCADALPQ